MSYQGDAVTVSALDNNILELQFNNTNESVNKFDQNTLKQLDEALDAVAKDSNAKGLLITSGKPVFIVGADITEFTEMFAKSTDEIKAFSGNANAVFNKLEDLSIPSVAVVNGVALGGGLELAIAADMRVASPKASLGFPEVQLGIIPGFGGTVRAPRIIGIDNAVEWICTGKHYKADAALAVGMVDAVVADDALRDAGLTMLQSAIDGKLDVAARKAEKMSPIKLNDTEKMMAFLTCSALVASQSGKNMPAPMTAVKAMEKGVSLDRAGALESEAFAFAKVAKTPQAQSMVGLFLNDQEISKVAKTYAKQSSNKVEQAAVIGAGIMGGGIAYQSAYKGTPIYMKDIFQKGLDQGMEEASSILSKRVNRKRMTPKKMGEVLSNIRPTLTYEGMDDVDIVVEAVVENLKVKQSVLAELETKVKDGTIIASNTSTISITKMAEGLQRPENFCGMHFFNPVHKMPLVEIIRGEKTSPEAIATVVQYALAMGKKPIVVNDCAGFFVNRVLFPYFYGFELLLRDGVGFQRIDKVMESFGWPMGPAYLGDVVGLDTCQHAGQVMAEAFPERMGFDDSGAISKMYAAERFGQKNSKGFYAYEPDRKGRIQKVASDEGIAIAASVATSTVEISDEEIVERMMVPMVNEVLRCLDEGIVDSAAEADMALIFGIGFPVFRGGICRYVDQMGSAEYVAVADKYAALGGAYQTIDTMRDMASNKASFF
ncbi:MAG: fatty acid oxidation complex subunit alpha FadB [Pseudomonadota bacterium]